MPVAVAADGWGYAVTDPGCGNPFKRCPWLLYACGPVPFDPVRDFTPISLVANPGGVFVVNAALPVRT